LLILLGNHFGVFSQDTVISNNELVRFFYPNGKCSSEGYFKNGKPNGFWKNYYESGNIKSCGNRKNNELDSTWNFYNEDQILKTVINYKEGKKNGVKITNGNNGKIYAEENFLNDVKQGVSKAFFENGNVKYVIPFLDGKENGRGVEFNENGQIFSVLDYKKGTLMRQQKINRVDKYNKKTGTWLDFYQDYSTKRETQYENDQKDGYLKEYNTQGNLEKIEKYIDDVLQVNATELQRPEAKKEYFANKKLKKTGSTLNGQPIGLQIHYDSTGKIEKAIVFENGQKASEGLVDQNNLKQGKWVEYYLTGEIKAEGEYENNQKIKVWSYYFINGKLEQQGSYVKGKPNASWKWFFENGKLLREEMYLTGKEDGFSIEYNEQGDTIAFGEYIDGEREGKWKFKEGDIKLSGNFKSGKLDSIWVHYFSNGSISFTGNFINGLPYGKHKAYYPSGSLKWEGKYVDGKRDGDWRSYYEDGTEMLTISYKNGIEDKYDGVRVFPIFEEIDFDSLIQENPYVF
jgi:antitoxin component YwqK of YwqJK toxin-antitoxin module